MASLELGGMRSIKLWLKTIRNSLKDTSAALSIPALEIKQLPESVNFNLPRDSKARNSAHNGGSFQRIIKRFLFVVE